MRNLIFILNLVFTSSVFAQNNWAKLEIGTSENLRKVVLLNSYIHVFSEDNMYTSQNFTDWVKTSIPKSRSLSPVLFKGDIYLNANDGVYRLQDEAWIKSIPLIANSLTANEKKLFISVGEGYLYESSDGNDYSQVLGLEKVMARSFGPYLGLSRAFGDTIILSGLSNLGPTEHSYKSYDGGVSWQRTNSAHTITDADVSRSEYRETLMNHAGFFFISNSLHNSIMMKGGYFTATRFFGESSLWGNFWSAGRVLDNPGINGLIMQGTNIGNIFYTPEQIYALEKNKHFLIAVGSSGAVYVLKNDFTDYFLIKSSVQKNEAKDDIKIFPNPAGDFLTIEGEPGMRIQIIDLQGKIWEELNLESAYQKINTSKLQKGVYLVKNGDKFAKLIKR
jgi:hypothetical protein